MLDQLQNEYDIVFVVAGTNKTQEDSPNPAQMHLGTGRFQQFARC